MPAPLSERISLTDYVRDNTLHREAFAALNREWLTRYFEVEPKDEAAFADPEGTVLKDGGIILMAEYNGKPVGTCSLMVMHSDVYEVAKMAVHEPYQGKGIGKKLLGEVIHRAELLGAKKLFIVSNTLLVPAIALYRAHGFTDSTENHHQHYVRGNITLERML